MQVNGKTLVDTNSRCFALDSLEIEEGSGGKWRKNTYSHTEIGLQKQSNTLIFDMRLNRLTVLSDKIPDYHLT